MTGQPARAEAGQKGGRPRRDRCRRARQRGVQPRDQQHGADEDEDHTGDDPDDVTVEGKAEQRDAEANDRGGGGETRGEDERSEAMTLDGAGDHQRQQRQHARRQRPQRAGGEAEDTGAHAGGGGYRALVKSARISAGSVLNEERARSLLPWKATSVLRSTTFSPLSVVLSA